LVGVQLLEFLFTGSYLPLLGLGSNCWRLFGWFQWRRRRRRVDWPRSCSRVPLEIQSLRGTQRKPGGPSSQGQVLPVDFEL